MEKLIEALKKGISKEEFLKLAQEEYPDFDFETIFELLKLQGLPLKIVDDKVVLESATTPLKEAEYTIVDIEVNNSVPSKGQAIEIGAVKLKNLEVVDEFSFLIYAKNIPKYVEKVTGINKEMLKGEQSQKAILEKFRKFLGDSIFIAHAADFDFNFLAHQFEKETLGKLLNRHFCSLQLAQKTLDAKKYGLKSLKEEFHLPQEANHRALGDARTTTRIFLKALNNLPENIKTTEDLVEFAKPNKKNKNPKPKKK